MNRATLNDFLDPVRKFTAGEFLPESLLLERMGKLATYYAPFEYINRSARLVICGITPGMQQAVIALAAAGKALREGAAVTVAQRFAKETASFAGPMRANLVAMLDAVGVAGFLGIDSAAELFATRRDLVHYTSALRNPVFASGKNYSGSPSILGQACLRWQVENYLAEEAASLPEALWVPLGPVATAALQHLTSRGLLNESRLLSGMPHPSGANAERIGVFLGRKDPALASAKTNGEVLLKAREAIEQKMANLRRDHGKGN